MELIKHVFNVQFYLLSMLFGEFGVWHLEIMIRYNTAAMSIILTPCIVHNSIQRLRSHGKAQHDYIIDAYQHLYCS